MTDYLNTAYLLARHAFHEPLFPAEPLPSPARSLAEIGDEISSVNCSLDVVERQITDYRDDDVAEGAVAMMVLPDIELAIRRLTAIKEAVAVYVRKRP